MGSFVFPDGNHWLMWGNSMDYQIIICLQIVSPCYIISIDFTTVAA